MLIVEGTDLVGKTTLCKKLLVGLPRHVYAHYTRLPRDYQFPHDYMPRASRYVVQDRFHMSEVAYAAVRGEESALTPERYRLLDGYLRGLGAYTVIVTATADLLTQRYGAREEMYGLTTIKLANERFKDIVQSHDRDWDYNIHCALGQEWPDDEHVQFILDRYRERQDALDLFITRRRPDHGWAQ